MNDDTFGSATATQQNVGKDFDFAGQTSQIANTIREEEMLYRARQPPPQRSPPKQSKPARSGYESYADPNYIPQLEARADIWGIKPKSQAKQQENQHPAPAPAPAAAPAAAPAKRMMSLEEVEAMMRAETMSQTSSAPSIQHTQAPLIPQHPSYPTYPHISHSQPQYPGIQGGYSAPPQVLQRPPQPTLPRSVAPAQHTVHAELPAHSIQGPPVSHPTTILQRQRPPPAEASSQQHRHAQQQHVSHQRPLSQSQPRQILQNPHRLSGHGQAPVQGQRGPTPGHGHARGPSYPGVVAAHPAQAPGLTPEQRAAILEEEAKRAKRNHKIALLAKDNGLMTPQDKNFITRIQLQQLMSAAGNVEEQGSEAALAEDFYYQVFSQIRGAPRQTPHQPANQFAQTYLFQTSNRYGPGRRHGRGADNHMQRMEQQVQRAVEAAKAKPKGKQLVIEGSLGKIAFSNSKTPRPLLSIKRSEAADKPKANPQKSSISDRKPTLRNVETVYITLMQMEDHERKIPPPIHEGSDPEAIQNHMEWRSAMEALHDKLWRGIKILEPINPQ